MKKLQTSNISPQYHAVFDNIFRTVFSLGNTDVVVDSIFNQLFEENLDWYGEEE